MRVAVRFLVGSVAALLVALLLNAQGVWAGGSDGGPDEHQDDGPSYFGFVKDTGGKAISDAKVTAEIKGRGTVVTRSDKTGTYKLPGFGKEVPPNNVTIGCSKEGYKQVRTFKRPQASKAPVLAIQIECTMERVGAK